MLLTAEETIYPDIKRCSSQKMMDPVHSSSKIVTFFHIVTIKAHDHVRDMSTEECEAAWYNKGNYMEMKKECISAIRLLMKGEYPGDNDVLCKRGIEYRTPKGSKQRKKNQRIAAQAVFSAQKLDRDDNFIQSEYVKFTFNDKLNALKTGHRDALEAAALYHADFQNMGIQDHVDETILLHCAVKANELAHGLDRFVSVNGGHHHGFNEGITS